MAGKPEDIPQDVWAGAENTLDTMLSNHGYEGWRDDSISTIARAIMSATAAAYAEIAEMVDVGADTADFSAMNVEHESQVAKYRSEEATLRSVAAAIRKHGEA